MTTTTDSKKVFLKCTYSLTLNEDLGVTELCLYTTHVACSGVQDRSNLFFSVGSVSL